MDMLGGSEVSSQCRKPEIMADAAYAIFCRPKSFTGNFVIDEEFLQTEGIRDFDVYAVEPGMSSVRSFLKHRPNKLNPVFTIVS